MSSRTCCAWALLVFVGLGWTANAAGQSRSETPQQVAERLANMSADEKEELRRKKERFEQLSPEEQQRLRDLHQQITSAPDAEKLQRVMTQYHAWLKGLRPGQRAEVLSLPPEERYAKIREIIEHQDLWRFNAYASSKLAPEDHMRIVKWLHTFVNEHEEELLERMPPEERSKVDAFRGPHRRNAIISGMLGLKAEEHPIQLTDAQSLVQSLSPQAQQALEEAKTPEMRLKLIHTWVRAAWYSHFSWFSQFRQPPVSDEELRRFLNEDLTREQQRYLEGMPAQQMRRELTRWYHFHRSRKNAEADRGSGGPAREPGRFEQRGRRDRMDRSTAPSDDAGDSTSDDPPSAE